MFKLYLEIDLKFLVSMIIEKILEKTNHFQIKLNNMSQAFWHMLTGSVNHHRFTATLMSPITILCKGLDGGFINLKFSITNLTKKKFQFLKIMIIT